MSYRLSIADLRARVRCDPDAVRQPEWTGLYLEAIAQRMNGRPTLFSAPGWHASDTAEEAFARWLDQGASGLEHDGLHVQILPGPAPRLDPLDGGQVVDLLQGLLTDSLTFYDVTILEPERLTRGFVHEEFGGDPRTALLYRVDVTGLRARMDETRSGTAWRSRYFDGLGNDHCWVWFRVDAMRIFVTNGSD